MQQTYANSGQTKGAECSDLRQTLEALENCKSELAKVQAEIEIATIKLRSLQRTTYNHPFPIDILITVFGYSIDGTPGSIGRLLLVCHSWYDIIMKSTALWTRIKIDPEEDCDLIASMRGMAHFVKACVERSGNLPLNIHLSFRTFRSLRNAAAYAFSWRLRVLRPPSEGTLARWVRSLSWGAFPLRRRIWRILSKPISLLVGGQGKTMARWRSATLHMGSEDNDELHYDCARSMWHCLTYPTPLLQELNIYGLYYPQTLRRRDSPSLHIKTFPSLPSLKYLRLEDGKLDYVYGLHPAELQEFHYSRPVSGKDIKTILRCRNLKILDIFIYQRLYNEPHSAMARTLPHLKQLHLKGGSRERDFCDWTFPALELLTVVGIELLVSMSWSRSASNVKTLVIKHENTSELDAPARDDTKRALYDSLPRFSSLITILVRKDIESIVADSIAQHSRFEIRLEAYGRYSHPVSSFMQPM